MDCRSDLGYFKEDFKKFVVSEIESGRSTVQEVKSTYGILGHSTLLKWCRRYGAKSYSSMRKSAEIAPKIKGDDEKVLMRNQIKVLEQELKESRWKQATLETLIDIAERHHSIVIKKNTGQKRLTK